MARAHFFHIGVTNNNGHSGAIGSALGCAAAAEAMADIARTLGNRPTVLTERNANYPDVLAALRECARHIHENDLVVLTLSGHGVQLDAPGGDELHDQAMILWDDYLVDDDIGEFLGSIQEPAKVVVIGDGCFFGSIRSNFFRLRSDHSVTGSEPDVLLLAASSSTSVASDVVNGGVPPFTRALLNTWRDADSYEILRDLINEQLPRDKQAVMSESPIKKMRPFVL